MGLKIIYFPAAILFACGLAGLYGALHNQISYTVSPAYFHEFKFVQFSIDDHFQNRVGASIVGWRASWWMGLVIGIPIYLFSLFVRGQKQFETAYLRAATLVVSITMTVGILALFYSYFSVTENNLPNWVIEQEITTPVSFMRAGTMHNFSYLGGIVGMVIGIMYTIRAAWKSRRS